MLKGSAGLLFCIKIPTKRVEMAFCSFTILAKYLSLNLCAQMV